MLLAGGRGGGDDKSGKSIEDAPQFSGNLIKGRNRVINIWTALKLADIGEGLKLNLK